MGHGAMVPSGSKGSNHHVAPAVQLARAKAQAASSSDKSEKSPKSDNAVNGHSSPQAKSPSNAAASPSSPVKPQLPLSSLAAGASGGSGSLAARRKMMGGLSVAVEKSKNVDKGDSVVDMSNKKKKGITLCDKFSDYYKLGKEVMPSTNAGMDVLFAKGVFDNVEYVVKTRVKKESFVCKAEEQEWRKSTELLLNLSSSENIARVHEVYEDKKTYYIVMEKVDGMDLFEVLHSEGRIPLFEAKAILRQLLTAVGDLHARGCIHKDLKLENVMVDKSPSPKSAGKADKASFFMDQPQPKNKIEPPPGGWKGKAPNMARRRSTGSMEDPPSPTVKLIDFDTVELFSPKDKAKSVVGTDQYIAQEAYAGHYSPASDIFSCGVIAYRLISGKFPFKSAMFDDKPGENWVGSPKMKSIQDRLNRFEIDWSVAPWPAEPSAMDLTKWMLQMNEKDRPTALQALEHCFFDVSGQTPPLPQGPWGSRRNR